MASGTHREPHACHMALNGNAPHGQLHSSTQKSLNRSPWLGFNPGLRRLPRFTSAAGCAMSVFSGNCAPLGAPASIGPSSTPGMGSLEGTCLLRSPPCLILLTGIALSSFEGFLPQKIRLNTPNTTNKPITKMIAIIHRSTFIVAPIDVPPGAPAATGKVDAPCCPRQDPLAVRCRHSEKALQRFSGASDEHACLCPDSGLVRTWQ